jgi:transcription antitermination factor NusA-like protein
MDAQGEKVQRKSKWSDQAPAQPTPNTNALFDSGIIKISSGNSPKNPLIDAAISINPEGNSAQHSLQQEQAKLFHNMLAKSQLTQNPAQGGAHIETIRPQTSNSGNMMMGQGNEQNNPLMSLINPGMNGAPGIMNTLNDASKIKRKIYVPKDSNFNYTGLIIGPRGANQKRLEEETGCKILVRGRGSQKEGQPPQPDDNEDQHVLIVGDNEMQIAKATAEIERIIFADEDTRNKIRQEQLKMVAQLKNDPGLLAQKGIPVSGDSVDLSLTTPYGPPSPDAFIIPVPNDCVGLVIGKGGETIKQLQLQSGAKKVQVAADSAPNTNTRNVFVEGDREAYERVKKMLMEIVEQQQRLKQAQTGMMPNNTMGCRIEVAVPDNLVGLVIGRGGETIKGINQRSGAVVYIPKECQGGQQDRVLVVSGEPHQIDQARQEIAQLVEMGKRNLMIKQLQAQGISPLGMPLIPGIGFDPNNPMDPNLAYAAYYQQYLSALDPNYAIMCQQMYAQQPEVTTVTETIVTENPMYQTAAHQKSK